jgi:glutaminyl-peptide cyclotransferase
MMKRSFFLLAIVLLAGVLLAPAAAQTGDPLAQPVEFLVPEVLNVIPHDTSAYTQGLLWHDGFLYESTGRRGESTLRKVDPATGDVLRSIDVDEQYFAEGLERVDDQLIQLTWQSEVAFVYDLQTFEQTGSFAYSGEGWGLCSDERFLYLSDGTTFLSIRERDTFELLFKMLITVQGQPLSRLTVQERPLSRLNELECVGDHIYANVWQTDVIVRIDRLTGVVTGVIDASDLLTPDEAAGYGEQEVLNGIAYLPESDTFMITGKRWEKMYEVEFVPAEQPAQ